MIQLKQRFATRATLGTFGKVAFRRVSLQCTALLLVAAPAIAAADSFGAIAYSGTSHRSTTAQSWNSTDEASQLALSDCNRETPAQDCFVTVFFQNACAALAVDYSGTWGAWWMSQTQPGGNGADAALAGASTRAKQACEQHAGGVAQCRVVAQRCAIDFHP